MLRPLTYICAQPANLYYTWQVEVWLESLLQFDIDPSLIHIVCSQTHKDFHQWEKLMNRYPTVNFSFYPDTRDNQNYISSIRPHILAKHFEANPYLKDCSIYYCDCDILFLNDPRIWLDPLVDDDIVYLSDTRGYVGYEYFRSKIRDVSKENDTFDIDRILGDLFSLLGHDLEAFKAINQDSGGAQHVLKGIDSKFWSDIEIDSNITYQYFNYNFAGSINRRFFDSEVKGFQSWTSDMWAMCWNLIKRGKTLRIVPEMDFAWPGFHIEPKWNILHNAGVMDGNGKMFYKGNYQNSMPYDRDFSHIDPKIMSSIYVQAIQKTSLTSCLK